MHCVSIAAFVVLGIALIATIVAGFSQCWISGTNNYFKLSGGLLKLYRNDMETTYETLQEGKGEKWKGIKANVDGAMAFMVFALLALGGGILITTFAFISKKKRLMNVGAQVITLAGTFTVIAISFYTGAMGHWTIYKGFAFGYSYGFAWFAMILDVVGGALVAFASHWIQ